MITLRSGLRSARVWIDELPDWHSDADEVAERRYPAAAAHTSTTRALAIELIVPVGARAHYGGLATVYEPAGAALLTARAPCRRGSGPAVPASLAAGIETPRHGLPCEFTAAIFQQVEAAVAAGTLQAGTLTFPCAVNGAVGSSPWFFGVLTRMLLRLLAVGKTDALLAGDWASLLGGEIR